MERNQLSNGINFWRVNTVGRDKSFYFCKVEFIELIDLPVAVIRLSFSSPFAKCLLSSIYNILWYLKMRWKSEKSKAS